MDWPTWVEKVFCRIVEIREERADTRQNGVVLYEHDLFPDIPEAGTSMIHAYMDLEILGLLGNPLNLVPPVVFLTAGWRTCSAERVQDLLCKICSRQNGRYARNKPAVSAECG